MSTLTFFTHALFLGAALVGSVSGRGTAADLHRLQKANSGLMHPPTSGSAFAGAVNAASTPSKPVVFAPAAFNKADFIVDGSKIPLLNATVQNSYAGQLPVSSDDGEKRKLFFWYWPTSKDGGSDTLTIWLNGGPGCSSMTGMLSELGAFTYKPGTSAPTVNEHAWSTVSDMLFVDQPLGTGFSNGTSDVKNEDDVANRFYGFLVAFYTAFPDLLEKKLYLAGESYAGYYIPYISHRILNASDEEKKTTPINLQSILINNGVFSDFVIGEYAPTARWAKKRNDILKLTDDELFEVTAASEDCGFDGLINQLTYPPKGPITWDPENINSRTCYHFDHIYEWEVKKNPCFDIYDIKQQCPTPKDPIEDYFNRPDVQAALHLAGFGKYAQCTDQAKIFPDAEDPSDYSETLFPALIEKLPRGVTIWHGTDDMILLSEGTRLTIQNITWGGLQGFQAEPRDKLTLGGKDYGIQHTERGLTYYEVDGAGHMVPADQPEVALEVFKTVIGKGGSFVISSSGDHDGHAISGSDNVNGHTSNTNTNGATAPPNSPASGTDSASGSPSSSSSPSSSPPASSSTTGTDGSQVPGDNGEDGAARMGVAFAAAAGAGAVLVAFML